MFAIDGVACRTVSQLFTCVLVTCISTWYGVRSNFKYLIRPEVTLCGWRDVIIKELPT